MLDVTWRDPLTGNEMGWSGSAPITTMKRRLDNPDPMEPDTTKNLAYLAMGLTLLVMVWFISKRAMKNRMAMLEASGPKIAGDDVLKGGARNPQQFEEPDDDALDEMAKLLGEDDDESDTEA